MIYFREILQYPSEFQSKLHIILHRKNYKNEIYLSNKGISGNDEHQSG